MLEFKQPAGTSRELTPKRSHASCVFSTRPTRHASGLGEAAVFPGLSPEADDRYFYKLMELQANVRLGIPTDLRRFPSLQFGFEQAIRDFSGRGQRTYFNSAFLLGEESLEINGLVWMGDYDTMIGRIEEKLTAGFHCIKLKIGAIDWKRRWI